MQSANCSFLPYIRCQFQTWEYIELYPYSIDEFQINEINVDLRTSGFDNEVLSVDACAV